MTNTEDFSVIHRLLNRLGVTANYLGFSQTAYALQFALREPDALRMITKWLYPAVGRHFGVSWQSVERNVRTVITVAWRSNRLLLEELAGRPLETKPCSAVFLAILTEAVRGESLPDPAAAPTQYKNQDRS